MLRNILESEMADKKVYPMPWLLNAMIIMALLLAIGMASAAFILGTQTKRARLFIKSRNKIARVMVMFVYNIE